MRPRDQHHNRRQDPTSWNLEDKPKDKTPLVILSFAVDECCKCEKMPNSTCTPPWPLWRTRTWRLLESKSHVVCCGITVPLTHELFSDSWKVTGVHCTRIELMNSARFRIPSPQNKCSHILGASHAPPLFCNKDFLSFTTNAESRDLIPKMHSKAMR